MEEGDESSSGTRVKGVFLREATGLVREAGWLDILVFASLNISWGLSAWWYFLWGPYFAPGGNLHLGVALVTIPMIFGALSWALLVTIAPRSGGDYVFVSRILHPLLGFLSSFGWVVANFVWIAVLSAYVADPALSITFSLVGWHSAAEFVSSSFGIFLVGALVILVSALVAIAGFKAFRIFQTACFVLGVLMFLAVWALLLGASRESFIAAWNSISEAYGSADYQTIVREGLAYINESYGYDTNYAWDLVKALPLMPVAAWGLIYPYLAAYIAGETRDVQRSMLIGIPGGLLLTAVCWWVTGALLEKIVGYDFLLAVAYVYGDGLPIYNLPFPPSYHVFAAVMAPDWLKWLIGIGFAAWTFYYALYSIMPMSRIFLAWAFDRLAPGFMADISERFHAPVKSIALITVTGFAALAFYAMAQEYLASFTAMIPQISTTFMLTAISAIFVPYRAKTKSMYESSPVSRLKLGPIPFVTVCGVVYASLLLALLYYYFTIPGLGALHIPSLITLTVAYGVGVLYFYTVKWYRRRQGIDIDLAFRELPPE
ncbi:MAG: APC family permease [Thermofilaceae archaeon]|nr:APC family permease [Thermofilaceae archaeon]MCX8181272.1 APC family permease [Thermofilaceae archaeon]MDW8003509.1 APC family permease [Thermofilaceae archaeon]